MRGDMLLFRSSGVWYERLVEYFTHGPFVHVEVDMGDGTSIGAIWTGIERHLIPPEDLFERAPVQAESDEQLEDGLIFLASEVGHHYGFLDIANQALKILRSPIYLGAQERYDCSDLVARYVAMCDGPVYRGLGDLSQEPHMVTPNDLGRAAGLIK